MKIRFGVQTPDTNKMSSRVTEGMKVVLWESMVKMEELAKNKAPVDRGQLKNRIHLYPLHFGAKKYELRDGVSYGLDLEYGNRPHQVKWESIEAWVKRKGITDKEGVFLMTRYVVNKIRTEGVNAQPFFRPALHEVQQRWLPYYKKKVFG